MCSVSKNPITLFFKKKTPRKRKVSAISIFERRRRRRTIHARRVCKKAGRRNWPSSSSSSMVSDKLQALKELIPFNNGLVVKADQLFQETANYIVLLRTQVFVLQRLIEFYGSTTASGTITAEADGNVNAVIV